MGPLVRKACVQQAKPINTIGGRSSQGSPASSPVEREIFRRRAQVLLTPVRQQGPSCNRRFNKPRGPSHSAVRDETTGNKLASLALVMRCACCLATSFGQREHLEDFDSADTYDEIVLMRRDYVRACKQTLLFAP